MGGRFFKYTDIDTDTVTDVLCNCLIPVQLARSSYKSKRKHWFKQYAYNSNVVLLPSNHGGYWLASCFYFTDLSPVFAAYEEDVIHHGRTGVVPIWLGQSRDAGGTPTPHPTATALRRSSTLRGRGQVPSGRPVKAARTSKHGYSAANRRRIVAPHCLSECVAKGPLTRSGLRLVGSVAFGDVWCRWVTERDRLRRWGAELFSSFNPITGGLSGVR